MAVHYTRPSKNRNLEWFMVAVSTLFGAWQLLPFDAMITPAYETVTDWAQETVWGALFLVLGVIHGGALGINGRVWWSPLVRFVAVSLGAMVYALFSAAFAAAYFGSTAVPIYALFSAGMIACAIVAARDAEYARGLKHGATDA
ncbi:hypothetical protein J4E08_24085 [Sagittula sp. NFXS13]|uniref:hypothetical protein n=1 Tax=Sagittula sp. NFXS13 TaxID=2819095 RepID=UPI0032DE8326